MTTHSATLRGVQVGDGTSYKFESEPEGLGLSRFNASRSQRPGEDGNRPSGPDTLTSREIVFSVEVWDGSTFDGGGAAAVEALLDPLLAAWAPVRAGVLPLTLNISGVDRVMYGRPVEAPVDLSGLLYGFARARLVFEATDPRKFAATASSIVLGLSGGGGGLTYPLTYPLSYGAGSDSDGSADNEGTTGSTWTASIVGPVTNPRLTLGSSGQYVELEGDVPAGSTLVLDSSTRSVLLDGSPRQTWLTLPSRWWQLATGVNTVRFRASSGTGVCTFSWRSAWQ